MDNQIEFFPNLNPTEHDRFVTARNAQEYQGERFVLFEKTCRRDRDYLIILCGLGIDRLDLYLCWCYYNYDEDFLHDSGWNDDILNYLNTNQPGYLSGDMELISLLPEILELLRKKSITRILRETELARIEGERIQTLRDANREKSYQTELLRKAWIDKFVFTKQVLIEKTNKIPVVENYDLPF